MKEIEKIRIKKQIPASFPLIQPRSPGTLSLAAGVHQDNKRLTRVRCLPAETLASSSAPLGPAWLLGAHKHLGKGRTTEGYRW